MLLLRRLVLNSALFRGNRLFGSFGSSDLHRLKESFWKKHPSSQFFLGRSFCRLTEEEEEEELEYLEDKEYYIPEKGFGNSRIQPTKEEFVDKDEIFKELSNGDPEKLKSLKLLEFEMAVLRNSECRVPERLTKAQWEELATLETFNQRKKYLAYIRLNEFKRLQHTIKLQRRHDAAVKLKKEKGFHYYGLTGHSLLLRLYTAKLNKLLYLRRMLRPRLSIVIDCSYSEYMNGINTKACAKQISLICNEARYYRYPCQVDVYNLSKDVQLSKCVRECFMNYVDAFNMGLYEEDFLDAYPREKLVYLSPHAPNDLIFNRDDVFVIGAYVDKGKGVRASTIKAKQANVRCARLPIDKYVDWKQGTKSLPLNNVVKILLDMAFYNDWQVALKNLPSRCLRNPLDDLPRIKSVEEDWI